MHPPAHLEVIEHDTCAEHVVLQGHQVWQAGVNDQPSLPLVDVHSVMFHESLPLIPFLGPVFRQLVCLWRQRGGLGHSARGADSVQCHPGPFPGITSSLSSPGTIQGPTEALAPPL